VREKPVRPPNAFLALSDLDDTPIEYRIPDLLTTEGNVLISAYRKAGKTSLILNLIAAMTTGQDFLGGLTCEPVAGPVVYVNLELHQSMLRDYCVDMGLKMTNDMVLVQDYRGHAGKFDLSNEEWRMEYSDRLWKEEAAVLIIDPISPLLAMNGVDSNDNDMARVVLENLGEIAADAKLDHLFIIDHTGHADKTRARGASAREDWADMLWNITADDQQGSPYRNLNVIGRGVGGHQRYMRQHKQLQLATGQQGAAQPQQGTAPVSTTRADILEYMRDRIVTSTKIQMKLGLHQSTVARELQGLISGGRVKIVGKAEGKGAAPLYAIVEPSF
jgi:hypothetical protein